MLGGLDWTGTALGRAFKSQEQVLFLFAGVIFIISVILHMLSIPEQHFAPCDQLKVTGSGESSSQSSYRPVGHAPPLLDVIAEEHVFAQAPSQENIKSDAEEEEMDFLALERVRSKSDSVLAMPDATVELDPDLHPDTQLFLPELHHFLPETSVEPEDDFKPSDHKNQCLAPLAVPPGSTDVATVLEPIHPFFPELKESTNYTRFLLHIGSRSHLKEVKSVFFVLLYY